MTLLTDARVVTPDEVVTGWVRVEGDRIAEIGTGSAPTDTDDAIHALDGRHLAPGFVDMHVHGGGGTGFFSGILDARAAAAFHLQHGTTTMLASLVSSTLDVIESHIVELAELVADGTVAGVHLEGPCLSVKRRGAHPPELLRSPADIPFVDLACDYSDIVRMVTLAPELPGALDAIHKIADAGIVVAIGHTDATYEIAWQAVDAGVTVATHLFNGMRPIHHREPGPVIALLRRPEVTIELINDGVHVHSGIVGSVFEQVTSDRVAFVTDAISATGMADGEYNLGGIEVAVKGGVAELLDGSSLAGSTLTMDRAFRLAVETQELSLVDAAHSTATTAARAQGFADVGSIEAGLRADFVVLNDDMTIGAVMRAGQWVPGREL